MCDRLWLDVPEVARHLSVCEATVWAEIKAGRLPSILRGRSRRIRHLDLERYADTRDDARSEPQRGRVTRLPDGAGALPFPELAGRRTGSRS